VGGGGGGGGGVVVFWVGFLQGGVVWGSVWVGSGLFWCLCVFGRWGGWCEGVFGCRVGSVLLGGVGNGARNWSLCPGLAGRRRLPKKTLHLI